MLDEKEEAYKQAYELLSSMSFEERMRYESQEAWSKDVATRRYEARMDGFQEGVEIGRREAACNLLQKGLDVTQIAKITSLSEEEILGLKIKLEAQ